MEELKELLADLKERKEELENCDNEEEYDEMLDSFGMVTICGMEYYPSNVLKSVDSVAYRCGHTDFNDSLLTDINQEIDDVEEDIADFKN